mgnify:CR=1 FL=1
MYLLTKGNVASVSGSAFGVDNCIRISYAASEEKIKQACQFMSANDDNWIYRQFTISEMITNIVKIQLYFGNELNLGCDVKNFLKKGTFYILNNLEYPQLVE